MSEYADPECSECGGTGFVMGTSMLTGGRTCDCERAARAAARWEREYPGVARERLIRDKHNAAVLDILDGLELDADAPPRAVVLVGEPGRGKTTPAVATMRRLATQAPFPACSVIRHPQWLGRLRASHRDDDGPSADDIIQRAAERRLVLLDDVGADERPTDFTRGATVRLLDARTRMPGSITIVTSNFPLGDSRWDAHIDPRGFSRLFGMARGRVLHVRGPDRRLS